jgi:hypothetical protein
MMNGKLLLLALALGISNSLCAADAPWTPAPGSPERVAICDAARSFTMQNYVSPRKLPQPLAFEVKNMKVLGNYCYMEAFPLFKDGTPMGTDYIMDIEFDFCLAKKAGKWRVVDDLSRTDVPGDDELKYIRRHFPKDYPLALLPEFWRARIAPSK